MPTILNFVRISCAVLAAVGVLVTIGNVLVGHLATAGSDLLGSAMWGVFFGITSYMKSRIDEKKRLSGFGGGY